MIELKYVCMYCNTVGLFRCTELVFICYKCHTTHFKFYFSFMIPFYDMCMYLCTYSLLCKVGTRIEIKSYMLHAYAQKGVCQMTEPKLYWP